MTTPTPSRKVWVGWASVESLIADEPPVVDGIVVDQMILIGAASQRRLF